jgi:hypothetical protein
VVLSAQRVIALNPATLQTIQPVFANASGENTLIERLTMTIAPNGSLNRGW